MEINGYMFDSELSWLASHARDRDLIFEVGCYKGRSTRALADNCRGMVVAIDPWNGPTYDNDGNELYLSDENTYNEFCENLKDHIKSGKVIICRTVFEKFVSNSKPDFIFIDADHRYNSVIENIKQSLEIIKSNGLLSGHDYYMNNIWPGVKKAVDEMFPIINLHNSIWSVKNGN